MTRAPDPRRIPRRGTTPSPDESVVPLRGRGSSARGGLADARRYTPRGRTVRESAEAEAQSHDAPHRAPVDPPRTERAGAERPRTERPRTERPRTERANTERPRTERANTERAGTERARPKLQVVHPGDRLGDPAAARKPSPGRAAAGRPTTGRAGDGRPPTGRAAEGAPTTGKAAKRRPASDEGRGANPRARTGSGGGSGGGAGGGRSDRPRAKARASKRRPQAVPRPADPRRRLRLGTVLALAIFTLIAGRLVQIQLVDAKAYAAEGLRDRLRTVDLPAPRGAIYDRDGAVLVRSVEARAIVADPTLVKDPEATADKLFPTLSGMGVSRSELVGKLVRHKRADGTEVEFEYLARGTDISVGDAVVALDLPGVWADRDERRFVVGHDLAANVVGFTRSGDHRGQAGIEQAHDKILAGVDGERTFERGESDLTREIPGGVNTETPARPGSSVRLTIDRDLQYDVQRTLWDRMRGVQATFGAAVVLNMQGEVLAQASYPSYDAAKPSSYTPQQRMDACTQIVFEPGSGHKAIVLGAALEEKVITPDTTVSVGPSITKGDQQYKDTHPHAKETLMTMPGLLALSSNIGTIKVADQLGREKLYEYQKKFGLGEPTNVGLPGEAPGQLLPPEQWTGSSSGSIPIGHGVVTTTLQMAAAYAAIANDGVWVQPHVVQATITSEGRSTPAKPPVTRRVISPETARQLRAMMEGVVTLDGATGKLAAVPGYRVSGKTGTGKMPQNGGYAPGDIASFIGMAPAEAPKYVIAVFAHVPSGGGGSVSAPAFSEMMTFALQRYRVPPTETRPPTLRIYP
ncbi:MAG TPA: penicillin-binding transpeptidase domain-containing protein [Micromonosporaceae bacterium]|nr:penicillin-binding transpeptidase domain-containing protein [Micromonosporaceae bacterium]